MSIESHIVDASMVIFSVLFFVLLHFSSNLIHLYCF